MTNKDASPRPETTQVEAMVKQFLKNNPGRTREEFLAELKSWGILDDEDLVLPPSTPRLSATR